MISTQILRSKTFFNIADNKIIEHNYDNVPLKTALMDINMYSMFFYENIVYSLRNCMF